jgi:hypothetical protein
MRHDYLVSKIHVSAAVFEHNIVVLDHKDRLIPPAVSLGLHGLLIGFPVYLGRYSLTRVALPPSLRPPLS